MQSSDWPTRAWVGEGGGGQDRGGRWKIGGGGSAEGGCHSVPTPAGTAFSSPARKADHQLYYPCGPHAARCTQDPQHGATFPGNFTLGMVRSDAMQALVFLAKLRDGCAPVLWHRILYPRPALRLQPLPQRAFCSATGRRRCGVSVPLFPTTGAEVSFQSDYFERFATDLGKVLHGGARQLEAGACAAPSEPKRFELRPGGAEPSAAERRQPAAWYCSFAESPRSLRGARAAADWLLAQPWARPLRTAVALAPPAHAAHRFHQRGDHSSFVATARRGSAG
ncbi:PREDICTED: uncharacterized protein LOC102007321 isoform X1 [Chinchilla lanigera]|uniref:uncharacterized protein LOC102007321 isoform X1 n=1 Tax=Chinchilla lanigera TaxID=34839 RepID=UPI00038F1751|nr:PREDICTED: uncharacterized protein LOC102007321 isoform X1 [Chinchilla lanigera]